MIPKRIKLSGFLCYKDEQEIAFDGASLWMLSGLNGSGKSSVFDAVTFALFGYHRGGSQGAAELINKGENGFAIEFDFQLEGQLHRIKRTLKRRASSTAATQQVLKWSAGDWQPVADTQRKTEFDAWVRDHIGLNYETFTSSVLLLQGRAEKLLDSTAKGRAEVLASIVDLERYQRLHEKADGERKEFKGRVETLQNRLDAIPEVSEMELLAAANRIEDADEALRAAQQEVERLHAQEYQSRQWAEAQRKLGAARERRAQAAKLIQQADQIDKELCRLKELRESLPHLEIISQRRADLSRSEDRTKALAQELSVHEARQGEVEHALEQARRRKAVLQKALAADESRHGESARQLVALAASVERVKLVESRQAELVQLEADLASFPSDLTIQVSAAQTRIDELSALERALSPLARLAEARNDLRTARNRADEAQQAVEAIKPRGDELRQQHDALKPLAEAARVARRQIEEKLTSERALLKHATELLTEFDRLEGSKVCRTCGQPLTPKHFAEERAGREKAKSEAEARVKQYQVDLKAAQAAETQLTEQLAAVEKALQDARDAYRDVHAQLQQANKDVARLQQDCQRAYSELTEGFRQRVAADIPADWLATTFPTAVELADARSAVLRLSNAKRDLQEARDAVVFRNNLTAQIKTVGEAVDALTATLTGDPAEVRREFARLDAEAKALAEQIKAGRQEERAAQGDIDRLGEEATRLREQLGDLNGKLQTEETTRKLLQQTLGAARKALTPEWQVIADRAALAELNRLRGEKDDLEGGGIEAKAQQLRAARIEVESLKQTLAELEREADQFPVEARRDPAAVLQEHAAARTQHAARAEDLNAAKNDRARLDDRARERRQVRDQLGDAERELKRCRTLAELLGRDRLQRHLVRQAERQIIDYANAVLDRLSSGSLMLRLVGSEEGTSADHALELEAYNRATGEEPINVAFLSGSQRFRVAVSLALGIGQYASRLHRPIESVIIDEGFGCLDRHGRQVMIQELQNLRGHLHCILLVSHQEEFAEAFADGYRFELADGATKVTRFQR